MNQLSEQEFVTLIGRCEPRVRAFVWTLMVPDKGLVDDVVQSTLIVAWNKLGTFTYSAATPEGELVRWLCGIANLEVRNARRQWLAGRVVFSDELVDQLAERQMHQLDNDSSANQRCEWLSECMQTLRKREYDLLQEKYVRERSARDIGLAGNRNESAVLSALSRIRRKLRNCIQLRARLEGKTG